MADAEKLITEHLDLWSSAIKAKTSAGRGSSKKLELYGISKLRELILDLAIRGMIVQQDESEGSASELMIEISRERDKQIREGNARKFKSTHSIKPDETPFSIPKTWEWVQLGDIQEFTNGFAFKSTDLHDGPGVGVVKIGDVYRNQGIGEHKMQFVTIDLANSIDGKYIIKPGEMVITMTGDVKVGFNRTQTNYLLNQRVGKIRCFLVNPKYIYFQLISVAEQKIKEASGGVIPNVSTSEINSTLISLPPLEEQHRIVAKVDELMALCDQLEEEQDNNLETHETLVSTLLDALTSAAADASQFAEAWQRIQDNFDILFTTASSVDQLKQSILQLAVMGKLVEQDPEQKVVSVDPNIGYQSSKKKKRAKWSIPIQSTEIPFQIPPNWEWLRLGDVCDLKHGYAFSSEFFSSEPSQYILTTPGNFYETGGFRDRESKRKYYSGPVSPEFIFNPGDLIMPMTEQAAGLLGSPAFIPDNGKVYLHNQRLGKMILDSDRITPEYAFCFFNCQTFRGELAKTSTGMKVRHTSPDRILKAMIPIGPTREQKQIAKKANELMALCDQLKVKLSQAQETQINLADSIVEQAIQSPA